MNTDWTVPGQVGGLDDVLVFLGVVTLAGTALLLLAARELLRGLRYRRLRPTPIHALTDASGRVTVSGRVERVDEVLESAVTGRPCVAHAWRVDGLVTERSFDQGARTRRGNLAFGRDAVPFRVRDDTGAVVVDPAGADLRLAEEWVPAPSRDPLERSDATMRTPFADAVRSRQYFESRLNEGETVVVTGRVEPSDERFAAVDRLGVQVAGGGTLVDDGTPDAAASRAFRQAAYTGLVGLFTLAIIGFLLFA